MFTSAGRDVFFRIETSLRLHAKQAKEQHTGRIIDTLNKCICLLPRNKLQHVSSIGLSGQMHGVLFWKALSGKIAATCPDKTQHAASHSAPDQLGNNGCDASSMQTFLYKKRM